MNNAPASSARRHATLSVGLVLLAGSASNTTLAYNLAISLHPPGAASSSVTEVNGTTIVGTVAGQIGTWAGPQLTWTPLPVQTPPVGTLGPYRLPLTQFGVQITARFPGYTNARAHAAIWNPQSQTVVDLHPNNSGNWAGISGPVFDPSSTLLATDGIQQVGTIRPNDGGGYEYACLWSGTPQSFTSLTPQIVPSVIDEVFGSAAVDVDGGMQVGWAQIWVCRFVDGIPWCDGGGTIACLWNGTRESLVILNPPGTMGPGASFFARADKVRDGQQIGVVQLPNRGLRPSLWSGTAASWVDLGPPDDSVNCQVIGVGNQYQVGQCGGRAVLWSGSWQSRVDLAAVAPGYSNTVAVDVWSDGATVRVVGMGTNITTGVREALLWTSPFVSCPSDVAGVNQGTLPDGELTADDIIVYLAYYFIRDARADIAGPNQSIGPDGQFSADDIITFLNRYFAGCE